jgi:hypothetical protein
MIKTLFKFDRHIPKDTIVVDTTSSRGEWNGLSPFILPAPPARNLENLWQFSKVYKQHIDENGMPKDVWYIWRMCGFNDPKARRYPMGKGAKPEYSYWEGEMLGYIDARKRIYIPEYAKNVVTTTSFQKLTKLKADCDFYHKDLILLDYDAYDHQALGMTLKDVVNNPNKIMGHAFVLLGLLTGEPMI